MTSSNSLKKWNKNVLILGSGYVGGYLSNKLPYNIFLESSKTLNYHDQKDLYKYLLNNNIHVVINCSGFTGRPNVDEGELKKEECWRLNVLSPLKVNKTCNLLNVNYIHISSGCIYTGYDKEFIEEDAPNFGLYDQSSFYSKSKHAFEIHSRELNNKIIRIRMPITPDKSSRNFLTKILNYDNLISFVNSKTYIPDLCNFIQNLIDKECSYWKGQDIYNVVNSNPLSTEEITKIMTKHGFKNPNWKFVDVSSLNILAPRSNCVLNGEKANKIYQMRDEIDILEETLSEWLIDKFSN